MLASRSNESWDYYYITVYSIGFKITKLIDDKVRVDWPDKINSDKNTFNRKQMAILVQPILISLGITMSGLWPFRSFTIVDNVTKAGITDKLYRVLDLYKAVGFINYKGAKNDTSRI